MMEQILSKSYRKRWNSQQIQNLLKEFEEGDFSVKQFCGSHNIGKATFYKWKSRYKIKTKKQDSPGRFASIQIIPSASHCQATLFAEVNGIKIYQPVAAAYLKELCSL